MPQIAANQVFTPRKQSFFNIFSASDTSDMVGIGWEQLWISGDISNSFQVHILSPQIISQSNQHVFIKASSINLEHNQRSHNINTNIR